MNLNHRISKIIEYAGFSSSEFADEIDVQRSSISHITSGRNKPSLDFIIKIKDRFPEINWDWIIKGQGAMLANDEKQQSIADQPIEKNIQESSTLSGLFSFFDENTQKKTDEDSLKPNIPIPNESESKITDSQPSAIKEKIEFLKTIDKEEVKIKKIVLFYDNGKFESYEP